MIAGAGALALTASPFPPTARFGWLTAALIAAAVLADLLILPALLAGLPVRSDAKWAERAAVPFAPPQPHTEPVQRTLRRAA